MNPAWRFCVAGAVAVALFSCASQTEAHRSTPSDSSAPADAQTAEQKFVVTPELYNRTFDEVKEVIANLTALINAQDYEGWLTHLTADYIKQTSDPAFLARASNSGVLRKSGIVLHTLKDYFENVVVRSRVQASLNDINFVDATHVKALTIIDGSPVILYYLVKEDGRWKVGIWPSSPDM